MESKHDECSMLKSRQSCNIKSAFSVQPVNSPYIYQSPVNHMPGLRVQKSGIANCVFKIRERGYYSLMLNVTYL